MSNVPLQTNVTSAVDDAKSILEELRDEVQSWYDNLPESFQNGEKGDALQTAADGLDSAVCSLDDAPEEAVDIPLFNIPVTRKKRRQSRSDRRDFACALLAALVEASNDHIEALRKIDGADERAATIEEWVSNIESAKDEAEAVEFPGMYS